MHAQQWTDAESGTMAFKYDSCIICGKTRQLRDKDGVRFRYIVRYHLLIVWNFQEDIGRFAKVPLCEKCFLRFRDERLCSDDEDVVAKFTGDQEKWKYTSFGSRNIEPISDKEAKKLKQAS